MNRLKVPLSYLVFLLLVQNCNSPATEIKMSAPIESVLQVNDTDLKIAVGSCNRHDLPQVLWDDVLRQKPNAWIWLGDIIYGDSHNMEVIQDKYTAQSEIPTYAELVKSTSIYGIWDDHDYGVNNAGKEFSKKAETRDLLFNFLGVPEENEARMREGAYQAYTIAKNNLTLKLILLDCRYFRDNANQVNGVYSKLEGFDILGEEQWSWLENELALNEADIHLIGNGIQIIPEDHKYEKWANFPSARQRLFDLLEKEKPNIPILISGDRHISEVSAINLEGYDRPLYEITSSGLTHPWTAFSGEENQHRIGDVINVKNYGLFNFKKNAEHDYSIIYQVLGDNNQLLQEIQLFNK